MSNENTQFKPKENKTEMSASAVQDALARLQLNKLAREAAEEQRAEDQLLAFRDATLASVQAQMDAKKRDQDRCGHMKPNFKSALGGQKDGKGNYCLICQYCFKEFTGDIPFQLRIPADMIGGPQ